MLHCHLLCQSESSLLSLCLSFYLLSTDSPVHGCQVLWVWTTKRLLRSGSKDQVVRKINKNTQDYCPKFRSIGHLIMLQQGNSLYTETVIQMFKDTEFSGNFYRVEWTEACILADTSHGIFPTGSRQLWLQGQDRGIFPSGSRQLWLLRGQLLFSCTGTIFVT